MLNFHNVLHIFHYYLNLVLIYLLDCKGKSPQSVSDPIKGRWIKQEG